MTIKQQQRIDRVVSGKWYQRLAFWQWPELIREQHSALQKEARKQMEIKSAMVKLGEWIHATHRLDAPPRSGIRSILSGVVRVVPFLLLPIMLSAQPAPFRRNAWTTNVTGDPVKGFNDLSVTNLGSGTNWLFYNVGPQTIARLSDVTNIASAFGGGSIATNEHQFLGVPLAIKSGARLTNMALFGVTTNMSDQKPDASGVRSLGSASDAYFSVSSDRFFVHDPTVVGVGVSILTVPLVGSYDLFLPNAQGANGQVLTNDGTGHLNWFSLSNIGSGDAGGTNSRQGGSLVLTNLSGNLIPYTNIILASTAVALGTNGGITYITNTLNTNAFQPASGNLTNWSNIPTGVMANVASTTFLTNWANAVSNYVTAATNSASVTNWITSRQPASENLTNWSLIPTGAMANVVSTTFLTNWANSISNLAQTKQHGTASLTNLSGNPNVVTQILAGANITVTSNNAGVFTIAGSGGGTPGGAQNSIQVNQPNGTFYGTNTATQVFAFDSTNGNMTIGNGSRTLDLFPDRWVMRELQDFTFGIFSQTNWRISSATPAGSLIPNSSNTVVIGNSTNPIATIAIVSNILLRDLAGNGKVLTSDADGVGTWQASVAGDAGGTNSRQFGSLILTNASLTGVITNAPWTTNFAVGYDLGAAISNLPNNSVANVLPGTHTVTPVIWATNGGVYRYPPITLENKTNVTINLDGATIYGHAALGTIMLITNCDNVTIKGDGLFDGLVQTNIATLIPTNVTWGLIAYYHCSNLKFKDFRLWNSHYHGIIDWGASFGSICSTNAILFDGLDIRNTGNKTTNNSIAFDGTAIVPSGGIVRNCYLSDNMRGVEPYTDANNALTDNTIIENNTIINTLDAPITTSGSTNNNRIQVRNNFLYQTKGYSRRGTNYMSLSSGTFVHMNGGHGHAITKNTIIGTNGAGITIGGTVMNSIDTSENYFADVTYPIIYGLDSPGASPHNDITVRGNVSFNTYGGYGFNGCRNVLIANNTANGFTQPFAMGFDISSVLPNTNFFLIGNKIKDTSGNLYASYIIRVNADRIIMSDNDGTNGTQSFIENLAGTGLIYRGQRNNDGVIFYSESLATAGNIGVFDEVYGAGWNGSTNVPTKNAIYDKIESLSPGGGITTNANQFGASVELAIKSGALLTNTLFYPSSLTGPATITLATTAQVTNLTEWRQTNGAVGVAVSSNGLYNISIPLLHSNQVAFRTNFLDFRLGQWQTFSNAMQTNLVLQLTNCNDGVTHTLDAFGAGRLGNGRTNAWQMFCTVASGCTIYWPPGTTNGNFDLLLNSNQVATLTFRQVFNTNIFASYLVREAIGVN